MRELWKSVLAMSAILLLLPFLLILLIQGRGGLVFSRGENLEGYLPMLLANDIDTNMHMETLKAQAVLTRSNVTKALREGSLGFSDLVRERETMRDGVDYEALEAACEETSGEVVTYEGEVCYCPFFQVSSGITRDAFEVFGNDDYPYLISVPSYRDEECESYITTEYFETGAFYDKLMELYPDCGLSAKNPAEGIAVMQTDRAGYVQWLRIGNRMEGGEAFREKMGLVSACFAVEAAEGRVRISCKGRGHGFGFSQFGADAMARDGKKYRELIAHYLKIQPTSLPGSGDSA